MNVMKKSDFKSGYIVVSRGGKQWVFIKDFIGEQDVLVNYFEKSWMPLDGYDDNLIDKAGYRNLDIMSVYVPHHCYAVQGFLEDEFNRKLIWERFDSNSSDEFKGLF